MAYVPHLWFILPFRVDVILGRDLAGRARLMPKLPTRSIFDLHLDRLLGGPGLVVRRRISTLAVMILMVRLPMSAMIPTPVPSSGPLKM